MKRKWKLMLAYLLTYVLVAGLITWIVRFVTGPTFILHEVILEGSKDTISDLSIFRQQNLLFLDTKLLKKQLLKESLVKSVTIRKILPDKLYIRIDERIPVVKLLSNDQTYFLDNDGVVLSPQTRFANLTLPKLNCDLLTLINGQNKEIYELKPIINIVYKINHDLELEIQSGLCLNLYHYKINLKNGSEIILDTSRNQAETITSLLFLVKQFRIKGKWPKVIDLRFDKPVLNERDVSPKSVTESAQETPQ